MKKIMMFALCGLLLSGCTSSSNSTSASPEASASAGASASASASGSAAAESTAAVSTAAAELNSMTVVLEEELPQSLTVTIQEMNLILPKSPDYVCDDELQAGDEITIYFEGDIQDKPEVVRAEKVSG